MTWKTPQSVEYGFHNYGDEAEESRIEAVLAAITPEQREALKALAEVQSRYFSDLREYARTTTRWDLYRENPNTSATSLEEQTYAAATNTADLALRMFSNWILPVAEILVFGEVRGELPPPETERLLYQE